MPAFKHSADVEREASRIFSLLHSRQHDPYAAEEIRRLFREQVTASSFDDISHRLCRYIQQLADFGGALEMEEFFRVASLVNSVFILQDMGLGMAAEDAENLPGWLQKIKVKNRRSMGMAITNHKKATDKRVSYPWWDDMEI